MEQIDLNQIKLEDEFETINKQITSLYKKGIITIADFINCDIDQIAVNVELRKQFRAYQKIFRYKYLGEPLTLDIILNREYKYDYINLSAIHKSIRKDMYTLGIAGGSSEYRTTNLLEKNGSCKMIDIIMATIGSSKGYKYLKNFYIEYYNTQMKKDEPEEHIIENDKDSLSTLKDELVTLLNQRTALDLKISTILEKINTLEGEKDLNARK